MSFLIRSAPSTLNAGADRESFDETIPEHLKSGLSGQISEPDAEPLPASSSSVIKFYPEWCTCIGGATLEYPKGKDATCAGLIKYLFQCPPFGPVARIILFLTVFALGWFVLDLLIGPVAGLDGPIFAVVLIEIVGLFTGITMKSIGLPALLAPLIFGIILRNIDAIDVFEKFKYPFNPEYCDMHKKAFDNQDQSRIDVCCQRYGTQASSKWITPIREIALTLILTRAGTELSPKQLRKLKGVVPALAFIPCITEGLTCAGLFFAFFKGLDPSVSICLVAGFSLAAVSPAVVVPGMLSLARKGYGVLQGVPTLLIAASSIDDVLAISLYTIALSIAVQKDPKAPQLKCKSDIGELEQPAEIEKWLQIAGGPLGIVIGVIYGIIVGCILHFLPSKDTCVWVCCGVHITFWGFLAFLHGWLGNQRMVILLCCNLACILGFSETEFLAGAGSLGVLTTSFVASFGWRSQPHWKPAMHTVEQKLTLLWALFVPILFGTIGKEMRFVPDKNDSYLTPADIKMLTDPKSKGGYNEYQPFDPVNVGRIIAIILISLIVRCGVTFIIAKFAGLNWKERLFVAFAWIPKATVQAALAPLVLSTVVERGIGDVKIKVLAMNIVVTAVFAILLTAPLGAILIAIMGPRLLQKVLPHDIEEEFPNGEADPYEDNEFTGRRASRATTASASAEFGIGRQSINESYMNVNATPSQLVAQGSGSNTAASLDSENLQTASGSDIGRVGSGSGTGIGSKGDTQLPRDIP